MWIKEYFQEWSDNRRANKMVSKLHTIPKNEWLGISHTLNRWAFPVQMYEFIPKWWNREGKWNPKRAMRIISPVMEIVKAEFGEKEELRYHNVRKGKMTNDEFEYWYSITRPHDDEELKRYYDKRFKMDAIRWWNDEIFNSLNIC